MQPPPLPNFTSFSSPPKDCSSDFFFSRIHLYNWHIALFKVQCVLIHLIYYSITIIVPHTIHTVGNGRIKILNIFFWFFSLTDCSGVYLFNLQIFIKFSGFVFLLSSFKPLWSEEILGMISVFLNLLRLVLWTKIRSILKKVPCVF